jgi:hypothetical protein
VEGTADAATLVERLEARVPGQPVTVVSDGAANGEGGTSGAAGQASSLPEQEATAPAPNVLEMDLHCDTCAKKVEKATMKIPGVMRVCTIDDREYSRMFIHVSNLLAVNYAGTCVAGVETVVAGVATRRVVVTGTADASAVAASVGARTRRSVTVVSQPEGTEAGDNAGVAPATATEGVHEPAPTLYQECSADTTSYYPGQGFGSFEHWTASYPETGAYLYPGQVEEYDSQKWTTAPSYPSSEGYYLYSEGPPGQVPQDSDENAGNGCSTQ